MLLELKPGKRELPLNSQIACTGRKQARCIISGLKNSNEFAIGANDTLIDLNGDGFKDLLIEYYVASGTGQKIE